MGIFGKEKPIKEYSINGRKFYLYEVNRKLKKKLERNQQCRITHLQNGDWNSFFLSLADMVALFMTSGGDDPHPVQVELRGLPYSFITGVIDDIFKVVKKAEAAGNQ